MYKSNKRGQSTVEYILLVTAVVAAMILFINDGFKSQMGNTLNTATTAINGASEHLTDIPSSSAGSGGTQNAYNVTVTNPIL